MTTMTTTTKTKITTNDNLSKNFNNGDPQIFCFISIDTRFIYSAKPFVVARIVPVPDPHIISYHPPLIPQKTDC